MVVAYRKVSKMTIVQKAIFLLIFTAGLFPFILHRNGGLYDNKSGIRQKQSFFKARNKSQQQQQLILSSTLARCRVLQYIIYEDPNTKHIRFRGKPKILSPQDDGVSKTNSTGSIHDPFSTTSGRVKVKATSYELPIVSWYRIALDDIQKKKEQQQQTNECVTMHEWQTTVYPSCNALQELDMQPDADSGNFQFINCGSSRCTFSLKTLSPNSDGDKQQLEDTIVLKVPKYRKDLTSSRLESARMDGMIMERLSSSPYVASIYGLCGTSQLTEYSDGGNIHDRIKEVRLQQRGKRSKELNIYGSKSNRVKIGIQVISAIADLHTFEKDGITSVVHQDICCHQIVLIDGVYKLGDFHLSALLQKNQQTGEVCPEQSQMHKKLRAPEEFAAKERSYEAIDLVPADVYMAGNIMFYLLTDKWIFEDTSSATAAIMLQEGKRSHISSSFRNSNDPYTKLLVKGIDMCWTHDPKKRPTARYISNYMKKELAQIEGTNHTDVVKVKMPALPSDHRYTDTDFYDNMW